MKKALKDLGGFREGKRKEVRIEITKDLGHMIKP